MVALPQFRSPTIDAIYRVYEARAKQEPERTYLGISILGEECARKLWYAFRWAQPREDFDGRMLRLFQTGHREEARVIEDLRAAGIDIHDVDQLTGDQWAVSTAGGHVRGHMDGIIFGGVVEAPKACHVFECKTHSVKSFKKLLLEGVQKSKPLHYAQCQGYMHLKGVDRALYVAVEKDTDTIHIERIHYDAAFAIALMAKGERIVFSDHAPAKLHDNPESRAAYACNWCPAKSVCHEGAWARVNCRTCLHAAPRDDGQGGWHCARHDRMLSTEDQQNGCGSHLFVPDLVPGKQIDTDPDAETVTYQLRDGSEWVDGAGKAVTG
ncbi:oxidoreductase [Roseibium sp. RKSG952]|uniref:oxidoreductase n=1 Tax=Roseibium sp. RKSG952 TaxID=2529384 RepID=UPI0012BD188A|nr:oxidoreductase [Roseibium sp. RKSG952]MTH96665.1 oxidoreductase [Roseibium sp. RKSG952]